MGEMSKQVRVDNWGVFFLQRLQTFFNKTDYCDLTLQFEGNVQLKVHRLVMYSCTDYFHVLEQTCEMSDDILIMPPDLQADVIVPIINFMYTGMLEFQLNMFDRLYQTATLMNITVLTKLLDAQRKPFLAKAAFRKQTHEKKIPIRVSPNSQLPATLPGRKLPVWKRKIAPTHTETAAPLMTVKPRVQIPPDPLALYDNTPRPTRFEWPEEELSTFNPLDSSFDDISYTSRPLLTQEEELKSSIEARKSTTKASKSNFNNAGIDVDDARDYVRQQKIRMDFEDDESTDNDLITMETATPKRKLDNISPTSSPSSMKRVRFNLSGEKENKETKINITTTGGKSVADMDHTKIISELLKKYPDLVKKNKNIRLKILPKNSNSPEKNTNVKQTTVSKVRVQVSSKQAIQKIVKGQPKEEPKKDDGPWVCDLCSNTDEKIEFVLYYLYRKHMTDVHSEKFDSRMCKFCGHKSNKHNLLMYHMYTKHGVKPPPAYNFPKCNQCHYIALTEALLIKHKLNHTKFELQCRECRVAFNSQYALDNHVQLTGHTGKFGRTNYDCQYCSKQYQSGANLFSHIKMQHREEAKKDGIVSIDEIEDEIEESPEPKQQIREEDEYITPEIIHEAKSKEKFKILQNVKVPVASQEQSQQQSEEEATQQHSVALEPSSEAEALSNVASGIATSLGLVDIVVVDNQQYILQSNQQLQNNQPEFILPELESSQFTQDQTITANQAEMATDHNVITQSMLNSGDIASTDELVMVLTDHDYGDGNNELITNDNSNIVVLYSHPVDGQENQFITSQGNLMVNSQTGMIEIRNGSAITTSAPNTIVVTQAQDTHIESIEMIQQEINSHTNATLPQQEEHQQTEIGDQPANEETTQEQEQYVEHSEPMETEDNRTEENETQDNAERVEEEVTDPVQEETADESEKQEEEPTEDSNPEETLSYETSTHEIQTSDTPQELLNECMPEEQQPESTQEPQNVRDSAVVEPQELFCEQQSPQTLPPDISKEDLNQEEEQEPQEIPPEEVAPELTAEADANEVASTEKDLEMPVLEEEQPPIEQCSGEEQQTEENPPQQEETTQDFPASDENSQSSHSSARQQTFDSGEALAATKISILDDWEDTDSQQSVQSRSNKSGNTVNKLMDDWADEEDDESKRTAH